MEHPYREVLKLETSELYKLINETEMLIKILIRGDDEYKYSSLIALQDKVETIKQEIHKMVPIVEKYKKEILCDPDAPVDY
jgi:hypothetical protein